MSKHINIPCECQRLLLKLDNPFECSSSAIGYKFNLRRPSHVYSAELRGPSFASTFSTLDSRGKLGKLCYMYQVLNTCFQRTFNVPQHLTVNGFQQVICWGKVIAVIQNLHFTLEFTKYVESLIDFFVFQM